MLTLPEVGSCEITSGYFDASLIQQAGIEADELLNTDRIDDLYCDELLVVEDYPEDPLVAPKIRFSLNGLDENTADGWAYFRQELPALGEAVEGLATLCPIPVLPEKFILNFMTGNQLIPTHQDSIKGKASVAMILNLSGIGLLEWWTGQQDGSPNQITLNPGSALSFVNPSDRALRPWHNAKSLNGDDRISLAFQVPFEDNVTY